MKIKTILAALALTPILAACNPTVNSTTVYLGDSLIALTADIIVKRR